MNNMWITEVITATSFETCNNEGSENTFSGQNIPITSSNVKQDKKQVISKKRVTDHGEVFTAEREVNAMLDLVKQETERIDSRFLEPACGTGNFLFEILRRKLNVIEKERGYHRNQLDYERYAILAVSSIYGIDKQDDNARECRRRLFDLFNENYTRLFKAQAKEKCRISVRYILERNIIHGDALTYKTVGDKPKPLIFSEWSPVNGSMLKRRDFIFSFLVEKTHQLVLVSDENEEAYLDMPVKEFPLTHFLEVANADKK